MERENNVNTLKSFWDWLKGDSVGSWIVSLIIAFVIVKFIFFPALSFAFGSTLPLVVVESSSMHHPALSGLGAIGSIIGLADFNKWWLEKGGWYADKGMSEQEVGKWGFTNGMEKGDIIVVSGRGGEPKRGDIIIFNAGQANPIIHRVINITEVNGVKVYSTKGDNNPEQLYIEKEISGDAIIGKAVFKIPKIGWLKLFFVDFINLFKR